MRRRIKALSLSDLRRRGEAHPEAEPVHGHAPPARLPLDLVQIDHAPADLILVDPTDREPIGRPWLTLRGVEASWPIQGKPRRVGVDNAPEFHSAAFERLRPSTVSSSTGARRGGRSLAASSNG